MMTRKWARRTGLLAAASALFWGCSGSDAGSGNAAQRGTVTEAWRGYCTVTFQVDAPAYDPSPDQELFMARAGDEYLERVRHGHIRSEPHHA